MSSPFVENFLTNREAPLEIVIVDIVIILLTLIWHSKPLWFKNRPMLKICIIYPSYLSSMSTAVLTILRTFNSMNVNPDIDVVLCTDV